MKKIAFLLVLSTILTMGSCKSKYPNLEKGLYAEFVTNKGTFVAKFYEEATPLTVSNFVELAEGKHELVDSVYKGKPYFNGLTFHRVIKDFMIQGGDPRGDGTGNPGYTFPDEFVDSLQHDRKGLLAMANSGPVTNGSQFFITLKETPWLTGKHTIFGEIVMGQEVVDSIGVVKTTKPGDKPVNPVIIEEVNIINKGNVAVPSFSKQMEEMEKIKQEKEARLAKVAEDRAETFQEKKAEAKEYDSGIKIFWDKEGEGSKPDEGVMVMMNYAGFIDNGKLFDTNLQSVAEAYEAVDHRRVDAGRYSPVPTPYSKDAQLIPGFREALLEMKVGDKTTVFIPSHLAWGAQGAGNIIPPNSDVVFEIEIVEIAQ